MSCIILSGSTEWDQRRHEQNSEGPIDAIVSKRYVKLELKGLYMVGDEKIAICSDGTGIVLIQEDVNGRFVADAISAGAAFYDNEWDQGKLTDALRQAMADLGNPATTSATPDTTEEEAERALLLAMEVAPGSYLLGEALEQLGGDIDIGGLSADDLARLCGMIRDRVGNIDGSLEDRCISEAIGDFAAEMSRPHMRG